MFTLAILIGIYSYLIFALGLLRVLYKPYVVIFTIFYVVLYAVIVWYSTRSFVKVKILQYFPVLKKFAKSHLYFKFIKFIKNNNISSALLFLLLIQVVVNLIGVLGPELSFDALWYHLTLPKIYLINHSINYIHGGLLYYSTMPKLTEMLYVAALSLDSETLAKLIHFSFGILSCVALYKLARKFLSQKSSLLAVVLFYSNLVVGWQSTTAYVDLTRTFFEIMALWGFVNFVEKVEPLSRFNLEKNKWLAMSAVMMGLSISTKLLSLGSLLIFSALIVFFYVKRHSGNPPAGGASRISRRDWRFWTSQNDENDGVLRNLFTYWFVCLLIPIPWFVFSFLNTGNPIYPFFTNIYKVGLNFQIINPFLHRSDSISIIYIIIPFLIPFVFKRLRIELKLISLYCFFAFVIWYLTPKSDTGRFILPYLPALSILAVGVIWKIGEIRVRYVFVGTIILLSLFSIAYRFGANLKYIPVIIGKESKADFLAKHLNFSFGDFYDIDGYFKSHIKQNDTVLLYGFHNLYYINFPFIDSSWVKKGDRFNYIAIQNSSLPERFKDWNLVYYNPKTNVKLYSLGERKWTY